MLNCERLPLSAYAANGAPSKNCKTIRSERISKDPWGDLSCPGQFLERIPGGARSFQMVSKDRWGPPGSSLNHLVALWGLHWEAECGQRYPWRCVEKLMFSNMLSTQVRARPSSPGSLFAGTLFAGDPLRRRLSSPGTLFAGGSLRRSLSPPGPSSPGLSSPESLFAGTLFAGSHFAGGEALRESSPKAIILAPYHVQPYDYKDEVTQAEGNNTRATRRTATGLQR